MTEQVTRRLATASRKAVRDRNYRRARDRALARLAHLHPDTYKQLLEMEKKEDERQGKTWIDLSGAADVPVVGVHTRATGADDLAHTGDASQDEGYNGGEA